MTIKKWPVLRIFFRWFESANRAIEGILHAAKTQPHLKFHLIVVFFVLLFCFVIGVGKEEFTIIAVVTLLVIAAEMFNTAVENMVDLLSPEKREAARTAKDVAAGAVLITSVGALVVGYLILWPNLVRIFSEGIHIHKHFPENIAVLSVIVNMLISIMLKAFSGTGLPLRGGFPSGHAAISFSIWISITRLATNPAIIFSTLALAILVSFSRLRNRIHSWREVLFGILSGSLVTWILFRIFQK